MMDGIFGFIAKALAEARQAQTALAAEQEQARAQFLARRAKFDQQSAAMAQGDPARVHVRRKVPPPAPASRPRSVASRPASGLTLFQNSDELVRAFVMAEVLAKPVALRDPSTFSPGAAL